MGTSPLLIFTRQSILLIGEGVDFRKKHAYLLVWNTKQENYRLIGLRCHGLDEGLFSPANARDSFGNGDKILKNAEGIVLSRKALVIGSAGGLFYTKQQLEFLAQDGSVKVFYFK